MYRLENNVFTFLVKNIDKHSIDIRIAKSKYPYKDPIKPENGKIGLLTLIDDNNKPTKIEIIHFSDFTDEGSYYSLIGVERGKEGTARKSFPMNSIVTQSITKDVINYLMDLSENNEKYYNNLYDEFVDLKNYIESLDSKLVDWTEDQQKEYYIHKNNISHIDGGTY